MICVAADTKGNINSLSTSEIKVDDSFPEGQFKVRGCALPFLEDYSKVRVGFVVFVSNDLSCKILCLHY